MGPENPVIIGRPNEPTSQIVLARRFPLASQEMQANIQICGTEARLKQRRPPRNLRRCKIISRSGNRFGAQKRSIGIADDRGVRNHRSCLLKSIDQGRTLFDFDFQAPVKFPGRQPAKGVEIPTHAAPVNAGEFGFLVLGYGNRVGRRPGA